MKHIYYFDVWEGDKGIIIADNFQEAVRIFKEEYGDDVPVCEVDTDTFDVGMCSIDEVGDYTGVSQLMVTERIGL